MQRKSEPSTALLAFEVLRDALAEATIPTTQRTSTHNLIVAMELPPRHVRFEHTPLNFKNKEIRLITIKPSSDPSSPIQITMENVNFSGHSDALTRFREEVPKYPGWSRLSVERKRAFRDEILQGTSRFIGLSYTWGPELPAQDILVTSPECRGWFSIRQNLYEFLKTKRNWLSARQNVDDFLDIEPNLDPASFWIDQLCINQGKNDQKTHQVNQMADIYRAAFAVEAWLGSGFEGSDELMDLIIHESDLSNQSPAPLLSVREQEMRTFVPYLRHFVRLPYWSRLWITQEVVLGRLVQMRIGSKTLLWDEFYQGWLRLERAWKCLCSTGCEEDLDAKDIRGLFRIREINSGRRSPYKSWESVKFLIWGTECEDLRDRAFGMMGMLKPSFRVFPDYSMDPEGILLMLLAKQVEVLCARHEEQYPDEIANWDFSETMRQMCLRTAADWLPRLEDDANRIDPKNVRRHIINIVPLRPDDPKHVFREDWKLRGFVYSYIPFARNGLPRILSLDPLAPVYRMGRIWRLNYSIWKQIPNERDMLWRLIRADYKRLDHISIPSEFSTEYPICDPSCLFADSDSIK